MAGSTATVTSKTSGEAQSIVSSLLQDSNAALFGQADYSSSNWTIQAGRPGAEDAGAAGKKLPALSKKGGLRHGLTLELAGPNVRPQKVPDAESKSTGLPLRGNPEISGSKRAVSSSAPSPSKGNAGSHAHLSTGSGQMLAPATAIASADSKGKPAATHAEASKARSPQKGPAVDTQSKSEGADVASRKRPGLRPSERSVEGIMNAPRPAGKLRLLPRAAQPPAGGFPCTSHTPSCIKFPVSNKQ